MSTGVFEVLAADQTQQVVAGRQAVSLATKRANERFGRFLLGSESKTDLEARMSLVADDLNRLVAATCEETGYENAERLAKTIQQSFRSSLLHEIAPDSKTVTASVHESRRPKMCPYHKEVVDISLAEGRAAAGFEAMSGHAFGPQHCDGGFDGTCNFRREMATQSWWDDRDKALQERREDRERQRTEEAERAELEAEPTEPEQVEDEAPVIDSEPPSTQDDLTPGAEAELPSDGLTEAPEGVDGVEAEVPMAVAASFQRLAPGKQHLPGASPKQNRQYEHIKKQYMDRGYSEEEAAEIAARTVNKERGKKKSEALETVDVVQRAGPSPKIDKRKWTPENLQQRVQTEGEGSPHPTDHADILDPRHVENNDIRNPGNLTQIGEATTERQDVSKDTHPTPTNKHTWPTGETTAVSSVQAGNDVDKNPIQEILESDYDGFIPQAVVQAAAGGTVGSG